MPYTPHVWKARLGTGLNKFSNTGTAQNLVLTPSPDSITQEGTPFNVDWMNELEQGVADVSVLLGPSNPTTATVGAVGQQYVNVDTNQTFICIAISGASYTWIPVGSAATQVSISDETAAKIWATPPADPVVDGALSELADLSGAVIKLPVAEGSEITAGDVVDVVDGHIVFPVQRGDARTTTVYSLGGMADGYRDAYIHKINSTDYLCFWDMYNSSSRYDFFVSYFSIVNSEISIHMDRRSLISSAGYSTLRSYTYSCVTLPDGRVLFACCDGTNMWTTILSLDKTSSTPISVQSSSIASGAVFNAVLYATNTEIYAAQCRSSNGQYYINIGKYTISALGNVTFSSWVKTFTSPTISGITALSSSNFQAQFLKYDELSNEGVLAFTLPYNSRYVLQAVNVVYDIESETWDFGGTSTIKDSFYLSNNYYRFWLAKAPSTLDNPRTAYAIVTAQNSSSYFPAFVTLQYDESAAEEYTNAEILSEYTPAQAKACAFFPDENALIVYVNEKISTSEESWAEYIIGTTGGAVERKPLIRDANTSTLDVYALSGRGFPLLEAQDNYNNSTLTFSVGISDEIPTTSQAIALESGSAGESIRIAYSGNVPLPGITKGTKITSDGVNAESYADGYLQIEAPTLAPGVQIATGSYMGTGTFGSSNPTTLFFDFAPKILWIAQHAASTSTNVGGVNLSALGGTENTSNSIYNLMLSFLGINTIAKSVYVASSTSAYVYQSADGKTFYLYSTDNTYGALRQMNATNYVYQYVAIG